MQQTRNGKLSLNLAKNTRHSTVNFIYLREHDVKQRSVCNPEAHCVALCCLVRLVGVVNYFSNNILSLFHISQANAT